MYYRYLYFNDEVILTFPFFFFYYFRALDKNEYNHITATYYLLAERKLKSALPKKPQISKKYFINICTEFKF